MYTQRRQIIRPVWSESSSDQPGICPVWSESSLLAWRKLGCSATYWVHSELWSDQADAQADLSLRWAHRSFCWFYCEVAHIMCMCITTMFSFINEPRHEKTCFMPYANYKDANQPAHPQSLIRGFIVRYLDSKIQIAAKSPLAEQVGLSCTWSQTPEDRFSHDMAPF